MRTEAANLSAQVLQTHTETAPATQGVCRKATSLPSISSNSARADQITLGL